MFTAIGLYLKTKFLNLKTILVSFITLIFVIKYLWLKFRFEKNRTKIKNIERLVKISKKLNELKEKKNNLKLEQKGLKERFPKE